MPWVCGLIASLPLASFAVDRFVTLRLISAIPESGKLFRARTAGSERACCGTTAVGSDDPHRQRL
jgi:hypothetical protein